MLPSPYNQSCRPRVQGSGPTTRGECEEEACGAAQAVHTIHEARIVHSDLKPANFLVVEGQLKLIDFGIAKAISSDTTSIAREAQARPLVASVLLSVVTMGGGQQQTGGLSLIVMSCNTASCSASGMVLRSWQSEFKSSNA